MSGANNPTNSNSISQALARQRGIGQPQVDTGRVSANAGGGSIADAVTRAQFGGYTQSAAGLAAAQKDRADMQAKHDALKKALDPEYLTPEVAPSVDPAARRGVKRAMTIAAQASGRAATVLTGGR
jgi:hypothetical protein